jgi:hypothetical protein
VRGRDTRDGSDHRSNGECRWYRQAAGGGPGQARSGARVERFGISCPPSAWKADCARRSAGGVRCAVGTGGQCSGVVTVTGTTVRPRVAKVDVSCFE